MYFYGDAPALYSSSLPYSDTLVLFYLEGKEGWTSPTWNGFKTSVFTPVNEGNTVIWEDGGVSISVEKGTGRIIGYEGEPGSLTLPEEVEGITVTGIGDNVFNGCESLTEVMIPAGYIYTGVNAFYNCRSLEKAVYGQTGSGTEGEETDIREVTIRMAAFSDCSALQEVVLPGELKEIEANTFRNCLSLEGITLPEGLERIGDYAFSGCSQVSRMEVPAGVTKIGSHAFADMGVLTEATLPAGLREIPEGLFSNCGELLSVGMPEQAESIGAGAFEYCGSLREINLGECVTTLGSGTFNNCVSLETVEVPSGVSRIEENTFSGCSSLREVSLPEGIECIGYSAFNSTSALKEMTLPSTLSELGGYAFYGSGLTKTVIPEGVTNIPYSCFQGCSSLRSVVLPGSLTSIESYGLDAGSTLAAVYFYGYPVSLNGYNSISGSDDLVLYYPLEKTGWTTPTWNNFNTKTFTCKSGHRYEIVTDSVNYTQAMTLAVEKGGILACVANAEEEEVLKTLLQETISNDMENGSELSDGVWIGASLQEEGNFVWMDRSIWNYTDWKNNIETKASAAALITTDGWLLANTEEPHAYFIEYSDYDTTEENEKTEESEDGGTITFDCLTGTLLNVTGQNTSFTIPAEIDGIPVLHIAPGCFSDCVFLEQIFTESAQTSFHVAGGALYENDTRTLVCVPRAYKGVVEAEDGTVILGSRALAGCGQVTKVILPDTVTQVKDLAFAECTSMAEFTFSSNLSSIGASAFKNCSALDNIKLPESLISIGNGAFANCISLRDIKIPDNVAKIEKGTFRYCTNLWKAVIPENVTTIEANAFSYCSRLQTVEMGGDAPQTAATAFPQSAVLTLFVTKGRFGWTTPQWNGWKTVYKETDSKTGYFEVNGGSLCFDRDTGMITGYTAFPSIAMIPGVVDGTTITGIGARAFKECFSLRQIYLPTGLTVLSEDAFEGLSNLSFYGPEGSELQNEVSDLGYIWHNCRFRETMPFYPSTGSTIGGETCILTIYMPVKLAVPLTFTWRDEGGNETEAVVSEINTEETDVRRFSLDISEMESGEYTLIVSSNDYGMETTVLYVVDRKAPAHPENFVVTPGNLVNILSWQMAADADVCFYTIYRSRLGKEDTYSVAETIFGRDITSWTDQDVEENIEYLYKISATDTFGQEGECSAVVGSMPAADTEAPLIDSVRPVNGSVISGIQSFTVHATDNKALRLITIEYANAQEEEAKWVPGKTIETNDYAYIDFDTTVLGFDQVKIRFLAEDVYGNSAYSPAEYEYAIDNDGPAKVENVRWESTASTVTLAWDDVPDEDFHYFAVEMKEESDGTNSEASDGNDPQSAEGDADEVYTRVAESYSVKGVNLTGLTPGMEYIYRVVAYDIYGNRGIASDPVTAITTADMISPVVFSIEPMPQRCRGNLSLRFGLSDDVGMASLLIQTSLDSRTWNDASTVELNDHSANVYVDYVLDTDRFEEGSLYVRGIVTDMAGNESNSSNTAPFVEYIVDRTAPMAPQGLTVAVENNAVHLTWLQGSETDLAGYTVLRAANPEGPYELLRSDFVGIGCYDLDFTYGQTYYYELMVADSLGNISAACTPVRVDIPSDTLVPEIYSISPSSDFVLGSDTAIQVLVGDNAKVDMLYAQYAVDEQIDTAAFSSEDFVQEEDGTDWTDLVPISVQKSSGVFRLNLRPGEVCSEKLAVRVWCTDVFGNESPCVVRIYTVDLIPPQVPVVTLSTDEEDGCEAGCMLLTWTSGNESDLAGFRVYRKSSEETSFSCVMQKSAEDQTVYTWSDSTVQPGSACSYYVEAVDQRGNTSVSEVSREMVPVGERADKTAPIAHISGNSIGEVGFEMQFSAGSSWDDTGIKSYHWDFGDESYSGAVEPVHNYSSAGTYTVSLIITDAAGNKGSDSITVSIREPQQTGYLRVRVQDENGSSVPDAGVYFDLGSDSMSVVNTDSSGFALLAASEGMYPVGAYKNGYLPVKENVQILNNVTAELVLTMVQKDIVVGELTVDRMTLDEIISAGININDEANQNVFKFEIELTYAYEPLTLTGICNSEGEVLSSPEVYTIGDRNVTVQVVNWGGYGWGGYGWGGGSNGGSGSVEEVKPTVAVLDIPGTATWLKDFFDVELYVLNQADEAFVLDDCLATLNVPSGLTLMDTNRTTSSPTVPMGSIEGQHSATAEWILRGDEPGKYDLSAEFSATLRDFGTQVNATFTTKKSFEVRDGSQLWLDIVTESEILRYTDGAIKIGFRNESEYSVYCPNLALEYVTLVRSYKMKGMKKIKTDMEELKTGEELWLEYIIPREKWSDLVQNEGSDMNLTNQILNQVSGIQMQYKFDIVTPMSICADKIEVYEYDSSTGTIGDPVDMISLKKKQINRAVMPDLYLKTYKYNQEGELEPASMKVRVFDGYKTLISRNEYYAEMEKKKKEEGSFFNIDAYPEFKEPWTEITTDSNGVGIFEGYVMTDLMSQNYVEGTDQIQDLMDALWGNVKSEAEKDKEEFEQENPNAKSNFRAFDLMFTASRAQTTIPVVVRGVTAQTGTVIVTVSGQKSDGTYELLADVTVGIGDQEIQTDADGKATLIVPTGMQKLTVKKKNYLTNKKIITVTERTELPIYLIPGATEKHCYISNISSQFSAQTVIIPENTLTGTIVFNLEAETVDGEEAGRVDYKIVDKNGNVKETDEDISTHLYFDITKLQEGDRLFFGVKPLVTDGSGTDVPVQWRDAQFTIVSKPTFLDDLKVNVNEMTDDGTFSLTKNAHLSIGAEDMFKLSLPDNNYNDNSLVGMLMDVLNTWMIKLDVVKLPAEIKLSPIGRIVLSVNTGKSHSSVEKMLGWFNESLVDMYGAFKSIKLDVNLDYDLTSTRWMLSVFGTTSIDVGSKKLADIEPYRLSYADAGINFAGELQLGSNRIDFEEGETLKLEASSGSSVDVDATEDIFLTGGSVEAALKLSAGVELISKWILSKGVFAKLGFEMGARNADILGKGARYIDAIIKAGIQETHLGQEKEHVKINERYELLSPTNEYVNQNMLNGASENDLLNAASEVPDYTRLDEFMNSMTAQELSEEGVYSPVKVSQNHNWSGGTEDSELLEDGAYFEADPQIVSLPDGSILMVYTDYQNPYNANNPLAVFYSVYKNETWTQPQPVREDGTLSVYPFLEKTEDGAHLTWLNVSEKVTGMEANNTLEQIIENLYKKMTVCEAWYDAQSGQWTMEEPIERGCYIESAVSAVRGDQVMTVWIENTENSTEATEEAPDSVCYRLTEKGTLIDSGQIGQNEYDITGLTLSTCGNGFSLSLETTDTEYTDHLYLLSYKNTWSEPEKAGSPEDEITATAYVDGSLYYLSNNAIYRKEETRTRQIAASRLLNGVKEFSAVSYGENGTALAWIAHADQDTVYLIISNDGIHYSEPIAAAVGDETFGKPQIAEQSEGFQIVYKALTEISTESGETEDNYLIRSTRLDAGVNIAITETWTDGYLSPGYQANTTVNIINRGTQAAENVLLRIASDPEGENVLAEREIGDARTATLTWYVPFDYDGEEYYVIASDESATEKQLNDNVIPIGSAERDAGIANAQYIGEKNGKTQISLLMENEGLVQTGPVTVTVTDISKPGEPKEINRKQFESIAGGDKRSVVLSLERPVESTQLYLEIFSELEDTNDGNNTQIVNILHTNILAPEDTVTTGTIGENSEIFWALSEDGILTLSLNEGAENATLPDYAKADETEENKLAAPWTQLKDRISSIIIGEGITRIGANNFDGLEFVTNIKVGGSVLSIGDNAFGGITEVGQIILPGNLAELSANAFDENLSSETKIIFNGTAEQWRVLTEGTSLSNLTPYDDKWKQPVWIWTENYMSATAEFTCEEDTAYKETIQAQVTSETVDAGCIKDGKIIYTASVNFRDQLYTDVKEVLIAATGHDWDNGEMASRATIFKAEQRKYTCAECGETEIRAHGKKLKAAIRLNAISNQITAGKKVRIIAQVNPGNVMNYPLRWTSSNPRVATVSTNGFVTVNKKASGKSVLITATSVIDSSEKATFRITVMKGAVKKIKIVGKKTIKAGKSIKLKAKVTTTKGKANKKVQWMSSNTSWATVAANGKVTAKTAGKGKKVTITAMATDGTGKKKTFKIKIK